MEVRGKAGVISDIRKTSAKTVLTLQKSHTSKLTDGHVGAPEHVSAYVTLSDVRLAHHHKDY